MAAAHAIPVLYRFSVAAWNSSIRQAVNDGHFRKALLLFARLNKQSHPRPNNLTFPFVAKACAKSSDLKSSRMLHAHVVKTPYCSDAYVHTALVDMYVKCGRLECAHQVFGEIPVRDVTSWNALIVGFAKAGLFGKASLLFNKMRAAGIFPDAVTLMGLTHLVSEMKDLTLLSEVHCFGLKSGIEKDVLVANTLISSYAKCGDLSSAEKMFSGIASDCLSVVSWNAMIAGFAYFSETAKAIEAYKKMLRGGDMADASSILNLLSSFAPQQHDSSLLYVKLIHAHAVKNGCDGDITVLNNLICTLSKGGDIISARCIFDFMNARSCVTWTVIIKGYAEKGDLDEALLLFKKMEAAGVDPDSVTLVHLIAACARVGGLELGRWIDDHTTAKGMKKDLMVCNALLDMYAKCGSMKDARILFHEMTEKNVVSWTTLISGFALNGEFQEALSHFTRMMEFDYMIKPNHVTFLAVLQACSHSGLLEKAWEFFNMMSEKYHLSPGLDHYACIADLLGRRGQLREAMEWIQQMPFTPDARIWGALLGACKIHHNVQVGEYAAEHLFRLESGAAAPYVEMANIYALGREWDVVAAMRMEMKAKKVRKFPGQSGVQIEGKCFWFAVEDRLHWNRSNIFETLDNLVLQLKDEILIFNTLEFHS